MLLAMSAPAAQQPTFRARVDAVRVDVLVTHGARPVSGLTTADFDLRDSGVSQQIEAIALEDVPLHLLLVLDTSSSVSGEPLRHLKEAAHAAVASLRPNDRVALMTFSHAVTAQTSWSADLAAIRQRIDGAEAGGSTSLTDAAFAALTVRPIAEGRMLVLLFTDGLDTASWLDPIAVIEQARRSDLVFDAVRLDAPISPADFRRLRRSGPPMSLRKWFSEEPHLFRAEFLPALAEETGGDLVVANRSSDLRSVFLNIVSAFKTRYVLTYSPKDVPASGWHPIDVRLKNKKGDVRARRGYVR
jgi:VWFA-related protein